MWNAQDIADAAAGAIAREEARRTAEGSPYGVESLAEIALHPVIESALRDLGCGVLREQVYPAEWSARRSGRGRRKPLPEESERQRCDFVLTPRPEQALADPLREQREANESRRRAAGTLFELVAEAAPVPAHPGLRPDEVYWLECKVVGQFEYHGGVPGPNGSYASVLVRGVGADLRKIRDDPSVARGGVLLVLFAAAESVVRADLAILLHRLMDKDLLVRSPAIAGVPVPDRIGNGWAAAIVMEPMRSG